MYTNIVLADDDHFYRSLLTRQIQRNKRNILVVQSGREVLMLFENQKIDLLIIDYHLADLTADLVLEKIRIAGSTASVIVMTGDESLETERMVRSCGADYYFVKPIDLHDFEIVVNGLINRNEKS